MNALAEIDSAIEFLKTHGARRVNAAWMRDYEVLGGDPIKAAKRLRRLLIERGHKDESGALRVLHR